MSIYLIAKVLFVLLACHFLGDFVLQTDYIAKSKKDTPYIMSVHSFLYSAVMIAGMVIVSYAWEQNRWMPLFIIFYCSHMLIDELKVHNIIKGKYALLIDQLLHFVIIGIVIILFNYGFI